MKTNDWWKRPFDLLVLTAAHIALLPLWLALWTILPLAIWMHDRGPVFYSHRRVGKGGVTFEFLKFRSMVPDAERLTGPVWAEEDDPRITPVGRFLRNRGAGRAAPGHQCAEGRHELGGPQARAP